MQKQNEIQKPTLEHNYGDNVFILDSPIINSYLSSFSSNDSKMPQINYQLKFLYEQLMHFTINNFFETKEAEVKTRMYELTNKAVIKTKILCERQKAVVISLARAGIYPSHLCFENLHQFLNSELLRQDHFYINRKTCDENKVIGVDVSGSKIGGDVDDSIVILPDPMGATGGSISYVIDHYKSNVAGKAKKYIALHLIVTPEYISKIKKDHPDVLIIALRLDRGLSTEKALAEMPGTLIDEEKGLNENHYIVPGAGGVGEILNNSFI